MSQNKLPKLIRKRSARYALVGVLLFILVGIYWLEASHVGRRMAPGQPAQEQGQTQTADGFQDNHRQVTATVFWVGEPPDADNANITNVASSWTDDWVKAYGGIDSYSKRCGFNPCGFKPKENPFYFALPYNDRKSDGTSKPASELKRVPWYDASKPAAADESILKNHWIAIELNGKTAYAQWQDVGPMHEDDIDYVFGDKPPKYRAGLDLSPAVNTYLDMKGEAKVSWRFVDSTAVPDGPWKATVTTSQLNFN